jgi:hypothetical protein
MIELSAMPYFIVFMDNKLLIISITENSVRKFPLEELFFTVS